MPVEFSGHCGAWNVSLNGMPPVSAADLPQVEEIFVQDYLAPKSTNGARTRFDEKDFIALAEANAAEPAGSHGVGPVFHGNNMEIVPKRNG
ncbi:MAG: hypothetical protein Q8P72_03205 [Candidatus Roizmanbacteria bacterium]|nr:hypothetical protein [Candidatus Roizmanbacteria bacterium]